MFHHHVRQNTKLLECESLKEDMFDMVLFLKLSLSLFASVVTLR